jgi:hypothetical protein
MLCPIVAPVLAPLLSQLRRIAHGLNDDDGGYNSRAEANRQVVACVATVLFTAYFPTILDTRRKQKGLHSWGHVVQPSKDPSSYTLLGLPVFD